MDWLSVLTTRSRRSVRARTGSRSAALRELREIYTLGIQTSYKRVLHSHGKSERNENPGFIEAIPDRLFRCRAGHEALGLYARSMIAAGKIKSNNRPE